MGAGVLDAEDAAAESLARAYASWSRVRAMASPEGWVMRVTANLVCDRARRARRETLTGLSSGSEGTCSFEDRMVNRSELLASLRRLPRRQREAVALRYLGGFSVDDVTAVQGSSGDAVRKRLERGLKVLRGLIPAGDADLDDTGRGEKE